VKGYGPLYYVAEAFRGLRANSLVNLLAVGTISLAMLITGVFLIVFLNLRSVVSDLGDRLEASVYLKGGLTQREKDFLQARLRGEPGVKKVSYLSKADALALFKKELKGEEGLIDGLDDNPLPDSFELALDRRYADSELLSALAKKISSFPGVGDVSYSRQAAEMLSGLYRVLVYGGAALAVLLGVSVVFIISNSVRLALYSRGQEIELMQWIGATKWFIQGPFLLEGLMLAMLGAALAVGALAALTYSLPPQVALLFARWRGLEFLPVPAALSMIACSGLLGAVGALVSVNKYLD
jgi:cell division transport system permease protein